MSGRALPGHAWVRIGPLGAGTLVARWPEAGSTGHDSRRGRWTVTGTLLAADVSEPQERLETADVIVAAEGAVSTGPVEWLYRYPGCAVAAAWTGSDGCSVATRDGERFRVAVSGRPGDVGLLACAVFAYGWLAGGWPMAALLPAGLRVGVDGDVGAGQGGRLFFRFGCCYPSGDSAFPDAGGGSSYSADSANRICRASGAPSVS